MRFVYTHDHDDTDNDVDEGFDFVVCVGDTKREHMLDIQAAEEC
jgi:hypothetical protein